MIVFKEAGRAPIKMWLNDIEPDAMTQAMHLSQLPFLHSHVAIMPDAHQGYGMPIGGVIATDDVVIPNAVGVDIGCGMRAFRTNEKSIHPDILCKIEDEIRAAIPMGFKHQKVGQHPNTLPFMSPTCFPGLSNLPVVYREYDSARKQMGTLGGGNHFIEIQKGSDGYIWIMIHSGSRNLGLQVASYYNQVAVELNKKWASSIPSNWQLAFLPVDTDQGKAYLAEMNWCVDFARMNRNYMMLRIKKVFENHFGYNERYYDIDIAHNYAAVEEHFGKSVVVHRKGAIKAFLDWVGIIPGSPGSNSYIVRGLGNEDSFQSCSHGAGRKMSRKAAINNLSLEEEQAKLQTLGVRHSLRGKNALDEAPGAYKDINVVMENQKDLIDITVEMTPILNIKPINQRRRRK